MTHDEILNCAIEGLEARITQLQTQLDGLRSQRLESHRASLAALPVIRQLANREAARARVKRFQEREEMAR